MSDWINAILFGIGLVAFVLGFSSVLMGFITSKPGAEGMQEKVEYGFFGVSGLVVCLVVTYALA